MQRTAAPAPLSLRWLGGRDLRLGGAPVHLESAKTEALLAWVVLNPGTHARARLMALLWPELPADRAAAGLRRALWDLRRKLEGATAPFPLDVSRGEVARNGTPLDLDVERLVAAGRAAAGGSPVDPARLEEALALYRGELLEGLAVDDAPDFEEWLLGERESLRLLAIASLQRLVSLLREAGELARALLHARRLLSLDPWLEEGHRAVAELLALTGRRGAAIRQLEACRRVLADELGAGPSAETVALERRLRGAGTGAPVPAGRLAPGPRNNLPLPASPFVGRARELDAVFGQLLGSDCRVLCLVGPGGVGKTRLAVQAASRLLAAPGTPFPDGVVFVPPPEARDAPDLAAALAAALELEGTGREDPAVRVAATLADSRLLVVVDACERRQADRPFLGRLLAAAPEVRLLVSSRERPGLPGERVLEMAGLETPAPGETGDPARWDAVRLFLSGARRARVGFDPSPADLAAAAEICRAVGGLPLAVEIAAGWVHALPPAEVAAQLAHGPGLLERSGPAGGLRRVYDEAVARLAPGERRVLLALSVFAGGMTWEAAAAVGRARPEEMRALADRSFLRLEASTGRYALHEVLRSFAAGDLARLPSEEEEVRSRHSDFVASFLSAHGPALIERSERDARDSLVAEMENVRVAWTRAVDRADVPFLLAALDPLAAAHLARGSWPEGERLADDAVKAGCGARSLVWRAAFRLRLGGLFEAEADLELAAQAGDAPVVRAHALLQRGHVALLRGRLSAARDALEAGIASAREDGEAVVLAEGLRRLGRAVLDEGRHEEARPLFLESLEVSRRIGNRTALLLALHSVGLVDYFAGQLEDAERRFEEAAALARAEGSRPGAANAVEGLGFVAEDRGALDEAAGFYRESLAACRQNGDRYGSARALMLLGEVERRKGAAPAARRFCGEALELARALGSDYLGGLVEGNLAYLEAAHGRADEARKHARAALLAHRRTGSFTVGLPPLIALAEVAAAEGRAALAGRLLAFVRSHPANRRDHGLEVQRVLARLRGVPGEAVPPGGPAGEAASLEELAAEALE